MSGRLDRFSKNPATAADYLAIAKSDCARMEARADSLKAQRDELAKALRYWMPDETLVEPEHRDAWNKHVALIAKATS